MSAAEIASLGEGGKVLDPEFALALAARPKAPPPPEGFDSEQLLLNIQPVVAHHQKEAVEQLGEGRFITLLNSEPY